MTKSIPINPNPIRPALKISRDEAKNKIKSIVEQGRRLPNVSINENDECHRWYEYSEELLKRICTTDEISDKFVGRGSFSVNPDVRVCKYLAKLETIQQLIDLYPEEIDGCTEPVIDDAPIKLIDNLLKFWHCKFALDDKSGSRIKELYEVCGQAQKSIRWLEKHRDFFTHLLRREPRHYKGKEGTRYEKGCKEDLLRIREKVECQRMQLRVCIVQPGLSATQASSEQLELLSVTENYLIETFVVTLRVIGSA